MRLVNCTPHTLTFVGADGGTLEVPPSGQVARCATTREVVDRIVVDGLELPIHRTRFGPVEGLPAPQPDTLYVVSAIVAQAVRRLDVVVVDDTVRDAAGRIIGARALAWVD